MQRMSRAQRILLIYLLMELQEPRVIKRIVRNYGGGIGKHGNEMHTSNFITTKYTDAEAVAAVEAESDLNLTGNLTMGDNNYLYFDTAQSKYMRYSTDHSTIVLNNQLTSILDLNITANSGADGSGNWEPSIDLLATGQVQVANISQGAEANRYFLIAMSSGMRLSKGGAAQSAIIKTDNIATNNKTFQFPNASGNLVTTPMSEDFDLTSNALLTDNLSIREVNNQSFGVYDRAGTDFKNFYTALFYASGLQTRTKIAAIKSKNENNSKINLQGYNNAGGWSNVAVITGGATQFFDIPLAGDITMLATKSVDCATNGGYFKPRRLSQSAQPTPDAGELMIWRDSDDNTVHLLYNDADEGVIDHQLN